MGRSSPRRPALGTKQLSVAGVAPNKEAAGPLPQRPGSPSLPEKREASSFLSNEPGECQRETACPFSRGPAATLRQFFQQIN